MGLRILHKLRCGDLLINKAGPIRNPEQPLVFEFTRLMGFVSQLCVSLVGEGGVLIVVY